LRLKGKVALVTGSSGGGLGTEIARVFAAEGAEVVVTGRSEVGGQAVVRELTAAGRRACFIAADLTERSQVSRLVEEAVATVGAISVLVNCAVPIRIDLDGPAGSIEDSVWDEMFAVNANAPRLLIEHVLPSMLGAGGGSIVNVSSRVAIRGASNVAAYSASKAALEGLTRSVAMDYGRAGIRCNSVAPGYIAGKDRAEPLSPERRAVVEGMHLTRLPTTRDVADAVLFLASDEAEVITGITLPVDGGGASARALTLG
jgi:NAD(P)-dependent dehydrogenase (short-subunit alcohol dehydrogenase family)